MSAPRLSPLRWAEGLALAGLGGVMLWLPLAGNYWYFLHPRFKPLTGGAGVLLLLLGLFAALAGGRPRLRRVLAAGCSLALVVGAYAATLPPARAAAAGAGSAPAGAKLDEAAAPLAPEPRVSLDGQDYLRMNVAELQTLVSRKRPSGRVAVRGVARRDPGLDAVHRFVLLRPVVVCCLADTVAAGYVVKAPGDLPTDGAWVEALGETRPADRHLESPVSLPGVLAVAVDPQHLFVARAVAPTSPPDIPFVFLVNESEPYAW